MENTNAAPTETADLTETRPVPVQTMREIVYGCDEPRRRVVIASRPMAVRRFKLRIVGLLESARLRAQKSGAI